jgi:hypothetical protein
MRGIKSKRYWTKSKCLEFAKGCSTQGQFSNANNGAYDAASRNGWLPEIYEYLPRKNSMGWLKSNARTDVWTQAADFYDIWLGNDKCGKDRMKTLTGFNLDKMIKKFKLGWKPREDEHWKNWQVRVLKSQR